MQHSIIHENLSIIGAALGGRGGKEGGGKGGRRERGREREGGERESE